MTEELLFVPNTFICATCHGLYGSGVTCSHGYGYGGMVYDRNGDRLIEAFKNGLTKEVKDD
jgi:hypothetical protein